MWDLPKSQQLMDMWIAFQVSISFGVCCCLPVEEHTTTHTLLTSSVPPPSNYIPTKAHCTTHRIEDIILEGCKRISLSLKGIC